MDDKLNDKLNELHLQVASVKDELEKMFFYGNEQAFLLEDSIDLCDELIDMLDQVKTKEKCFQWSCGNYINDKF